MADEEMILDTDDRAAKRMTITGWVSRDGRFYGDDERIARYAGCTHRACEDCGQPARKSWLVCDSCRSKREWARWREYPEKPWDGLGALFADAFDEYFFDLDCLYEFCYDNEVTPDELRLVHCQGQYAPLLDENYLCDVLPEDEYDIPRELADAMEAFNAVARKAGPLSYYPAKVRATVPPLPEGGAER